MTVNTRPYLTNSGYLYKEKSIYKFGYNEEVGTNEEDIWDEGGTYAYASSAETIGLTSSNAGDTGIVITVQGLDSNYDEISEDVTLDGTNPQTTKVDTSNQFLRVNRMKVNGSTTPSGNIFAGTGTLTTGKPANVRARITAGENQTLMAIWCVPRNHTGYLVHAGITSATNTADKFAEARLKIRDVGEVFRTQSVYTLQNSLLEMDYSIGIQIAEKSDIKVCALASTGTCTVSANFSIIYKQND